MDPARALRYLGGSARRADLLRQTSARALTRAVSGQEVVRVARGRYALPLLPPALQMAGALSGVVSHASAAQYWQLEAIAEPASIHITVPPSAHRRAVRAATLHYAATDAERITSPLRTVLDCARSMPFREGLAIADSALRRQLITRDELMWAAHDLTGPGSRVARRVCAWADARAANPFESALRASALDAGQQGFVPQFLIDDTWRVDLGDPKRRIVAEADSFTFHGSRAALDRDCRRYDEMVSRGWLVLRFSWEQVMFDEPWVIQTIATCAALRPLRRGGSMRTSRARGGGRAA